MTYSQKLEEDIEAMKRVMSRDAQTIERLQSKLDEATTDLDKTRHRVIEVQDDNRRLIDKCEYLRLEDMKADNQIDASQRSLATAQSEASGLREIIEDAPHSEDCAVFCTESRIPCDCWKSRAATTFVHVERSSDRRAIPRILEEGLPRMEQHAKGNPRRFLSTLPDQV